MFLERSESIDEEIYVPFYRLRNGPIFHGYKPVLYLGKILRPVPVLCGADFSATAQKYMRTEERFFKVRCTDDDVDNFCSYMRAIEYSPGGILNWSEVEKMLKCSKLFD